MSARDELVQTIIEHPWLSNHDGLCTGLCPSCPERQIHGGHNSPSHAEHLSDAILAAGYRKPRTVTTVEELDALPVGAVVVDAYAAKCVLVDADRDHLSWRRVTTAVHGGEHRHEPYLPATVLHEGNADV